MGMDGTGATLQVGATAAEITGALGSVAELTKVPQAMLGKSALETTNHGSPGGVQEFIPGGIVKLGPMTFEMNQVPGSPSDIACSTAAASKTLHFWKVQIPKGTGFLIYTGQCVVTDYKPGDAEIDSKLTASLTIQPSGIITRSVTV